MMTDSQCKNAFKRFHKTVQPYFVALICIHNIAWFLDKGRAGWHNSYYDHWRGKYLSMGWSNGGFIEGFADDFQKAIELYAVANGKSSVDILNVFKNQLLNVSYSGNEYSYLYEYIIKQKLI